MCGSISFQLFWHLNSAWFLSFLFRHQSHLRIEAVTLGTIDSVWTCLKLCYEQRLEAEANADVEAISGRLFGVKPTQKLILGNVTGSCGFLSF